MSDTRPSGTEGYADEAEVLLKRYESIPFVAKHEGVMRLLPDPPARVIDIGAGTGRDAAGFAALGYSVTAVEPTPELRLPGMALHASHDIRWIDDFLPDLTVVSALDETFDMVMLTAVWMHLDEQQRRRAMTTVARLMRPGGMMTLSLRHGPIPPGRRMFEVTPAETIALAEAEGLAVVQCQENADSLFKRPGISWDRLAFKR